MSRSSVDLCSKCCGNCGKLNHKLGASKIFKCPHCEWTLDRDMNGARNIMIKNLEKCGFTTTSLARGFGGNTLASSDACRDHEIL